MQGTDETIDPLMVKRALAQLSAEHRAVLWRSHYLGWSLAHIAADLQIAEDTVKSRLHDTAAGAHANFAGRPTIGRRMNGMWRASIR